MKDKPKNHLHWCRKAFENIQYSFMIKTLNELGAEGNYLNIVKCTYLKSTAINIPNDEKQSFC